ncbi:hypothetical protein [Sphingobacterium sp. LRF_L2]|uniref:hypothetical protein n=1 Tax=Sphingobacterium sp. LRF_L2 TaxID=3369421 RepID=UPI003F6235AB
MKQIQTKQLKLNALSLSAILLKVKPGILLPLLLLNLFWACKKDIEPNIDYNVLTEQRILEISEQTTISEDDIATLERLNGSVTDNSLKAKYTEMIAGVKILKDFIPSFNELKTNPDVIFQDLYAQLEEQIKMVTDKLPRKAKIQEELASALANYNTEEYEYLDIILESSGLGLRNYLANTYNIHPVSGKPNRYLKADIERVDKLIILLNRGEDQEGLLASVLKTFKGLTYLNVSSFIEKTIDLNHLTNLETLIVNTTRQPAGWELKIDNLEKLKHLIVEGDGAATGSSPFGETIDFTNKYPLLETLDLPLVVTRQLTSLLLPNKQYLTKLTLPSFERYPFQKLKRLVVQGKEIGPQANFVLGSSENTEMEEVTLSGFGGAAKDDQNPTNFSIGGSGPEKVKIKKLSLSNISVASGGFSNLDIDQLVLENVKLGNDQTYSEDTYVVVGFNNVDFPQKPDFQWIDLSKVKALTIQDISANGTKLTYADIQPMLLAATNAENLMELMLIGLTPYPEKTIDVRQFKSLTSLVVNTVDQSGTYLEKVIVNKAMENIFAVIHWNDDWTIPEPNIEIEYVNY